MLWRIMFDELNADPIENQNKLYVINNRNVLPRVYEIGKKTVLVDKQKSKFFYNLLIDKIFSRPSALKRWEDQYQHLQIDWAIVFQNKIILVENKKIAEFNYKVINNILPCGNNLYKWKKIEKPECPDCGRIHNLQHLLYSCDINTYIWQTVKRVTEIENLEWLEIGLGLNIANCRTINTVISTVSFCIYKYWLLKYCVEEHVPDLINFLKVETTQRAQVYERTKYIHISSTLYQISESL
jgi:hypothetical protein